MTVTVSYSLGEDNVQRLTWGSTTRPTVVNLHLPCSLQSGRLRSDPVYVQRLQVFASRWVPTDTAHAAVLLAADLATKAAAVISIKTPSLSRSGDRETSPVSNWGLFPDVAVILAACPNFRRHLSIPVRSNRMRRAWGDTS